MVYKAFVGRPLGDTAERPSYTASGIALLDFCSLFRIGSVILQKDPRFTLEDQERHSIHG